MVQPTLSNFCQNLHELPLRGRQARGEAASYLYISLKFFGDFDGLHVKLGNLRLASGVSFVVTSVHFWKNDPISGFIHYHCFKLSSTCTPDPEDVSRYFVCCQKMFCGYAEDD